MQLQMQLSVLYLLSFTGLAFYVPSYSFFFFFFFNPLFVCVKYKNIMETSENKAVASGTPALNLLCLYLRE